MTDQEREESAEYHKLLEQYRRSSGCAPEGDTCQRLWNEARESVKASAQRTTTAKAEQRERAFRAEMAPIERQIRATRTESERVHHYREWFDLFNTHHGIVELVFGTRDTGSNHAVCLRRHIVIDSIVDDATIATALHEGAHIRVGTCPETLPHYRDDRHKESHHCLECERLAWKGAIDVAPAWSRGMHDHLGRCISSYTDWTIGPPEVFAAIDELKRSTPYADYEFRTTRNLLYYRAKLARVS